MYKLFLITIILATLSTVTAIQCNFVKSPFIQMNYTKENPYPSIRATRPRRTIQQAIVPFECEEILPQDDNNIYEPITVDSRNQFDEEDDVCTSTTKPLVPKELNNIYNKLIKVHQDHSFVQTIYITECTNPKSDCSNNGYIMHNRKIICRQHYVRITLTAENEAKKKYQEEFYYPSACTCQMVAKKISTF